MYFFQPYLLLFIAPALILGIIAQWKVRSAYAKMRRIPASMSGFAAARRILDAEGLSDVAIEQVGGHLSDHYDPREKVLRLSEEIYHGHSMASVGIAAHEAGHAIQDARQYAPLVIRNAAVPAAHFGSNAGLFLLMFGVILDFGPLLLAGIILFGAVVVFQVVNLPVEFDASKRAKLELVNQGIISQSELPHVSKVLNAAALTYVAATLQAILTLLYYVLRYLGRSR